MQVRIYAFSIFIICALVLMTGYMTFMELVLSSMFLQGETGSMLLQLFATVMFPATFFMFMMIGYLTYYFIWRAFNVHMEIKWALILNICLAGVLVLDAYQIIFG